MLNIYKQTKWFQATSLRNRKHYVENIICILDEDEY